MNRPYRKKEMTSGCIQCIDRVYRSEKRTVSGLPPSNKFSVAPSAGGGPRSGSAAAACRCASCGKIIIGYSSGQ